MNREHLAGILARANEFKEGDLTVGGTRDDLERKEARLALSALRLAVLLVMGAIIGAFGV